MRESKLQSLLEGKWAGKEGQDALNLFFELVGPGSSTNNSFAVEKVQIVRYLFFLSVH